PPPEMMRIGDHMHRLRRDLLDPAVCRGGLGQGLPEKARHPGRDARRDGAPRGHLANYFGQEIADRRADNAAAETEPVCNAAEHRAARGGSAAPGGGARGGGAPPGGAVALPLAPPPGGGAPRAQGGGARILAKPPPIPPGEPVISCTTSRSSSPACGPRPNRP